MYTVEKQIRSRQRVAEYGEVFTAEREVESMCNLVQQETEQIDSRFLEPTCGDGNFLSVILKRKLRIVKNKYGHRVYDWERNSLLALGSLYGIDIMMDNVTACQERLFEIWDKEYQEVSKKENSDEIRKAARHILRLNIVCGNALNMRCVDADGRDRKEPIMFFEWTFPPQDAHIEKKDYSFVEPLSKDNRKNQIYDLKFDVIIGNPPYQKSDGGNAASALPIYHEFVEQALKLNPRFLSMIIPARWFMGGRGLDRFRHAMLHDDRIRVIHDFPDASDCFPGVEIKGGVCYFLWVRDDRGLCEVHSHNGKKVVITKRPLLEDGMEIFIRNDTQISVLRKVRAVQEPSFSEWMNAGRYFGFHTKVEWDPRKKHGMIQTADGKSYIPMYSTRTGKNDVKVYIHGGACWLKRENVPKHQDAISKYKVIIPRSGNPKGSILGKPILSEPNTCSSNTYVVVIPPSGSLTMQQAENISTYLKTKFVRFLVAARTSTQDMPPKAYSFVPLQDFSVTWSDEKLYKKYGFTKKEIKEIETMIPDM